MVVSVLWAGPLGVAAWATAVLSGGGVCGSAVRGRFRLFSGRLGLPAAVLGGESEHGEAGEVDGGGEQGEVGCDRGLAPHSGAPAAVSAAHQAGDLAPTLGRVAV